MSSSYRCFPVEKLFIFHILFVLVVVVVIGNYWKCRYCRNCRNVLEFGSYVECLHHVNSEHLEFLQFYPILFTAKIMINWDAYLYFFVICFDSNFCPPFDVIILIDVHKQRRQWGGCHQQWRVSIVPINWISLIKLCVCVGLSAVNLLEIECNRIQLKNVSFEKTENHRTQIIITKFINNNNNEILKQNYNVGDNIFF